MHSPDARALVAALSRDPTAWNKESLERRWSSAALRSAVRARQVVAIIPGLYVGAEHQESLYSRASAATLWMGGSSALVGAGAAAAWGVLDIEPAVLTVSGAYGAKPTRTTWLSVRRLPMPVPQDLWSRCPVATPAFTVITCFEELGAKLATASVYRAIQQGLASVDEIAAASEQIPRLRGRRELDRTLAAAASGCESHLEAMGLWHVFRGPGFEGLIRQHRIIALGRPYRLDTFDPATRTDFELDGSRYHGGADHIERDRRRDASLAALGVLTVRFSFRDITERPDWCRKVALMTLASRAHGPDLHAGRAA